MSASVWMRLPPPRTAFELSASTWRSAGVMSLGAAQSGSKSTLRISCGRSPMPTFIGVPAGMPARWWRRTRRWLSIRRWRVRLTAPGR